MRGLGCLGHDWGNRGPARLRHDLGDCVQMIRGSANVGGYYPTSEKVLESVTAGRAAAADLFNCWPEEVRHPANTRARSNHACMQQPAMIMHAAAQQLHTAANNRAAAQLRNNHARLLLSPARPTSLPQQSQG